MAIDVWIAPMLEEGIHVDKPESLIDGDRDELLLGLGGKSLSFLEPYFQIVATETGQQIEDYGDAYFSGCSLLVLKQQLQLAETAVPSTTDLLDQHRSEVQATVEQLLSVVRRAESECKTVVFLGD